MFSASVFLISLIGAASLVSLRMWEMKRDKRLFSGKRARLDEWAFRAHAYMRGRLPAFGHPTLARLYRSVMRQVALFALSLLRAVERKIISLLEYLRGKRDLPRGVTHSEFLRKVSEHKRNLEKPSKDAVE